MLDSHDISLLEKIESFPLHRTSRSVVWRVKDVSSGQNQLPTNSPKLLKSYVNPHSRTGLEALPSYIGFLAQLLDSNSQFMQSRLAVPQAVVSRHSQFIGFTMKEFVVGCTFDLNLIGKPKVQALRQLKCFLNSPSEQRELGVPNLELPTRLLFVEDFLKTLSILHSVGIIIGDISESNLVLQKKKDSPSKNRVIFLDVDSFSHVENPNPLGSESTPGWWAPEQTLNGAQVSQKTDIFKSCLLIKRFLHHVEPSPADSLRLKSSSVLSKFLIANNGRYFKSMLDKGTSNSPANRPTSTQIYEEFKKFLDNYLNRN